MSEHSIQNPTGSTSLPASLRERVTTSLQKTTDEKASKALAMLMRSVEIGEDFASIIQRDLVYLARVPKHLEKGVKSGALTFMQKSDTGESLGAIVGSNNLNRGFVRIEKGYLPNPNLIHSLSNLAMQQQLAHISEVIEDVRSRVIALQETHDKSLNGKLRGMHKQLIQMMDAQNTDIKKQLATNAITVLNSTRGEITQRLVDELSKLPETPRGSLGAVFKTLTTKGFKDNLMGGYDKIQELFSYYLAATQLLAYAYAFLDEPASYEDVFLPDADIINNSNLRKLPLAEKCVGSIEDAWYKRPEEFLGKILKESQKLFCEDSDSIEINVTGEQLLEAINNGQNER